MREFRRDVPPPAADQYWFVEMGPIPGKPDWHMKLYANQVYAFPRLEAARLFAKNHRGFYPDRDIAIRYPDGFREELPHVRP